jgi:hypothetical protein
MNRTIMTADTMQERIELLGPEPASEPLYNGAAVNSMICQGVAAERQRWTPLLAELRILAERCEWPDGDAAQVIAQLWAEEWVRKIDGPNEG